LETCWKHVGNLLETCWKPKGHLLETDTFWKPTESFLQTCWKPAGNLLEPCWKVAETFWTSAGNILVLLTTFLGLLLRVLGLVPEKVSRKTPPKNKKNCFFVAARPLRKAPPMPGRWPKIRTQLVIFNFYKIKKV